MQQAEKLMELNSDLTPDVMRQVDEIIDRFAGVPGCLIPVLEDCQENVGYLPVELQEYIGRRLNIPGSTIYGVVTFYSFFSMVPKGRHTVKVCMGTACYVRGIAEVLSRLQTGYQVDVGGTTDDRRFSLDAVRCLGACGLAPVVVVDDDTHGGVTPDRILGILERYE
ncbi:MAG: NAD(P)H-dependent oxidoreductase subunit E [Deltaproteobacteria bacterium]|nr:NAD(P)H-dependent oxidoreductase subunit E [Deltaproteobacteria bacterium]